MPKRLRHQRIDIKSTPSGEATSAVCLRRYVLDGHVRLRRNMTPAARAPSARLDRTTETIRCIDFGQRLRRRVYISGHLQGYAFGTAGKCLRQKTNAFGCAPSAERLRRCRERKCKNRPGAKSFAAMPSALRLRRYSSRVVLHFWYHCEI